MLRGIETVVTPDELEPGRFYLLSSAESEPQLFQCVRADYELEGAPVDQALIFNEGDGLGVWLEQLPTYGPVVRLAEAHVRINQQDIRGNQFQTSWRPGMIGLTNGQVILAAPLPGRGFQDVDLLTGRYVSGGRSQNWVSCTALSFVIDEGENEREIGRYVAPRINRT